MALGEGSNFVTVPENCITDLNFLFWNGKYEEKFINGSWVVKVVNSNVFGRHRKIDWRHQSFNFMEY